MDEPRPSSTAYHDDDDDDVPSVAPRIHISDDEQHAVPDLSADSHDVTATRLHVPRHLRGFVIYQLPCSTVSLSLCLSSVSSQKLLCRCRLHSDSISDFDVYNATSCMSRIYVRKLHL